MLNFNSILLFSEDPKALGEFYKKVFDMEPGWNEGGYMGFWTGTGAVTIGPHDKVHGKNQNPERIIINFETNDVEGEFARVKELGAKVVAEPYHPSEDKEMWLATFEDSDGNYFQLASPFKM